MHRVEKQVRADFDLRLGQLRGALGLGDIGADDRREMAGQRDNARREARS